MKKSLKKYLSIERRDVWDSPNYNFWHLSVDRLKHKLLHVSKRDRKVKRKLEEALRWRCHRNE